ncbi:Carboxylesterase family [Nesidiocoris tenuis]|uniref:Carboxylesterase family n=1 Tax=Nesidiocoris tenuis TaxID=355587 RepID=A0ABN7ACV0_9HEMI|nr:Carboxylesterase family [Nesidiocoris tenuis]
MDGLELKDPRNAALRWFADLLCSQGWYMHGAGWMCSGCAVRPFLPSEVPESSPLSTTKPRMKSHYRGHKMAIWLNLIPQLHQPGDQDVSMRHHHFHERANHFYAGAIKAESFTRIPPTVGGSTMRPEPMDCPPNVTGSSDEPMGLSDLGAVGGEGEDDEADLLERHYYSTSTALGVTVGVGCLLLVLNALIFSAIYYQRRRRKAREENVIEQMEIKTLSEASSSACALPVKHPPTPPLRTSSVPPAQVGSVKKRVQIQEISV